MDNQQQFFSMTDVRQVWLFTRRNLRHIVAVTLGTIVFAFVMALVLPSRYKGETVIMLDPRKTNLTNLTSVLSDMPADSSAIRSEIDIITSRAVIDRVIEQQHLMEDADFNSSLKGMGWLLRFLSSHSNEDKAHQAEEDRTKIAEKLFKHLEAENDGRSYSIKITYYDGNAERASNIANAFADEYLNDQLEVKFDVAKRANTWLGKRLDELQTQVRQAEHAVEEYKTANNLVDVGDETLTQEQMSNIDEQLVAARADLSQAEARLNSVKDVSGSRLATSSMVMASPLIQQLKQQEAEVRRKEADLATRYGDRHPAMIDVRNELRSIQDKIDEEMRKSIAVLRNDYDIAKSKVSSLEQQLGKLKAEAGEGNKAMVTLHELQRQANANRSLYEGFLDRFKQVGEQQDMQIADSRIIARANVPIKPYFPNLIMFLVAGVALGMILGFMSALLIEYLNRGLRSLSDAEKLYNVPGLGIVPLADTEAGHLPTDYIMKKPMSIFAESIRSVRAAIHFSNVDKPPRTIVITSTMPGEGKTMFSTSLARLQAKAGHKVILIDADMRRPRLHSIMSLDKTKPDLAKLLAGEATLEEALQKDTSGVDVIIASGKTTNPQDLLTSHRMETLLTRLAGEYDMVIIDTPPILAVADAALVAQSADAVVYIARWSSTPREVIGEGLKQLRKFNIRLAGLVLNQVDLEDRRQYGYDDYGHYYGKYKNYYAN
ncbi:MAG: polysaccharide biosynthesis tyrosine autokinase [Alphaproteobacteria bacterium]|nr:polysaccharide biosynthesis tyrosine autokinase [Alphaproteobacteria bacterium]MBV8548610.1 polysaccharide biosynthesis tyrosine autokinase [Alphaproteobacteria bacterium]